MMPEDWVFMQDNAPPHVSRHTLGWLQAQNIFVLPWPARSPDLNPIENVWSVLARQVYGGGRTYSTLSELNSVLDTAFEGITTDYLRTLYDSMPSRLISVIAKGGAITKY